MGFGRFRYSVQPVLWTGTTGGPTGVSTSFWKGRDFWRGILSDPIGGIPTSILNFAAAFGVDLPVPNSWNETSRELPPGGHYRRRKLSILSAGSSTLLGSPLPILDSPPDTTPLFTGRSMEALQDIFSRRRINKFRMVERSLRDSPGRWAAFINAASYSANSCDVMDEIQRHLIVEPDHGLTWDLWSPAEVISYFNQRLATFLSATGILKKRYTTTTSSAENSLPQDLIEIRRVSWNGKGLRRVDPQELDYGFPNWEIEVGTPIGYIEEPQASLTITLYPTPSISGTLGVIYVPTPDLVSGTCSPLPIPNFLIHYIKWGVIADLLKKEGPGNDPERANYGEQRFTEGVELARLLLGSVA